MDTVKISPKYQIVIPANVRRSLDLKPGQKLQVVTWQNRIELIPDIDIKSARGFLKGIDTSFKREPDRL